MLLGAGVELGWGLSSGCASVWALSGLWDGERLMGTGFVLQEGAEGPRPALQHAEEPPGPDQGVGRRGPSLQGACLPDSPQSCLPRDGLCRALPLVTAGVTQLWGEQDPWVLAQTRVVCSLLHLPPTSPQTHPSAWPFMEPVKKSEAPDYYEIIRFPIGKVTVSRPPGQHCRMRG